MKRLWHSIRIPLAVVLLAVASLGLVRIFSGPEDTWIKNERGEWVAHGRPAGPPPPENYREPLSRRTLPVAFLVAFAVPLFFYSGRKLRNRLTFDSASRDIRFYGYLGTALFLLGALTAVGLAAELFLNAPLPGAEGPPPVALVFLTLVAGFAGLCLIAGCQMFLWQRNCNDHYQLEKNHQQILELLEKIRQPR